MTKARRRDFELQSSELRGNKNDLSAQLQIQLVGFENKFVPFFRLKVSTLFDFFGQGPKMVWGSKPYVNMTEHNRQKRALGFPVRHNASQNNSLQNAFPIFECQMERRYKMQYTPFYYKNWCTGPFFPLDSPRNRGWYQARVDTFSSGNGKGDCAPSLGICKLCCKPSGSWLDQTLIELESSWPCSTWTSKLLLVSCRHGTMGRWEDEAKNIKKCTILVNIEFNVGWNVRKNFVQFVGLH